MPTGGKGAGESAGAGSRRARPMRPARARAAGESGRAWRIIRSTGALYASATSSATPLTRKRHGGSSSRTFASRRWLVSAVCRSARFSAPNTHGRASPVSSPPTSKRAYVPHPRPPIRHLTWRAQLSLARNAGCAIRPRSCTSAENPPARWPCARAGAPETENPLVQALVDDRSPKILLPQRDFSDTCCAHTASLSTSLTRRRQQCSASYPYCSRMVDSTRAARVLADRLRRTPSPTGRSLEARSQVPERR